jgi:hypothetical protein
VERRCRQRHLGGSPSRVDEEELLRDGGSGGRTGRGCPPRLALQTLSRQEGEEFEENGLR